MIRMNDICKTYSTGTKALDHVSLNVKKGQIVSVIGHNGAGKSTLFKILCGIITKYSGESLINGKKSSISLSDRISYLPEVRGIDGRKCVIDHLTNLLMYKGYSKKDAEKYILDGLEQFDMLHVKYEKIGNLSKGNQQKLQIILAITNNPDVIILDEPFSGLDLITVDYLWDIIYKLRDKGCTILFSTHNLTDNVNKCDSFFILKKGHVVESGTLQQIQENYSMILEIENESLTEEILQMIEGVGTYSKEDSVFKIEIASQNVAVKIFDALGDKYCKRFYVRKFTLPEIFRAIGKDADNE